MTTQFQVDLPTQRLNELCRKWQVTELALFGSALRSDFHPESDVDLLVTFSPTAKHSIFDLMQMQKEFQQVIGRKVDLVERKLIEESDNYIRRNHILETAQVIYGS